MANYRLAKLASVGDEAYQQARNDTEAKTAALAHLEEAFFSSGDYLLIAPDNRVIAKFVVDIETKVTCTRIG